EAAARAGQAKTALDHSRLTLARNEKLLVEGLVATEEVDHLRSEELSLAQALAAAEFARRAAEGERDMARAALLESGRNAALAIRAPADGLVLRKFEESERVVPAGTPLVEIGDPSNIEVVVEVLSTDAVGIRPGMAMIVEAGGDETVQGRVRVVEPAGFTKISPLGVEEQRVRVVGDLLAPAPGVGDRFRVIAKIVLWHGEDVLKAPSGAIFRYGEGWGAYSVRAGRARLVELTVGHRGPDESEILAGLAAGDEVIAYPGERVEDGVRVVPEG
ncbi:MAG TPA: HlyD family efflux transporter periplasmic adaptor subunit, partial [Thermoanaerobaculia bacterium]|nr:HlyD family efflux transporter periplasmic adaptor subunit [Thermoanaerobaculia bacterium]